MSEENKNELENEVVETTEEAVVEDTTVAEEVAEKVEEVVAAAEEKVEAVVENAQEAVEAVVAGNNKKVVGAVVAVVAVIAIIAVAVLCKIYGPQLFNKYNRMGYVNTSGNTIADVADQLGMTVEEFLAEYELPEDMPDNTEETAAFYTIPFTKFVEMNGYEMEEFRTMFEISDEIADDATWGEVEATITLKNYIGEEYLEEFKQQYGLGDEVTADTTWGEIRRTVHLKDKADMEAAQAEQEAALAEAETEAENAVEVEAEGDVTEAAPVEGEAAEVVVAE